MYAIGSSAALLEVWLAPILMTPPSWKPFQLLFLTQHLRTRSSEKTLGSAHFQDMVYSTLEKPSIYLFSLAEIIQEDVAFLGLSQARYLQVGCLCNSQKSLVAPDQRVVQIQRRVQKQLSDSAVTDSINTSIVCFSQRTEELLKFASHVSQPYCGSTYRGLGYISSPCK